MSKLKPSKPISVDRILRPQTGIHLTLEVDDLTGQADIRPSMILDLDPDRVIVAQTDPPLMKSYLRRRLEASVVRRNPVTREILRLGWKATVLSFENAYKLNPGEKSPDQAVPIPIIGLSRPTLAEMTKSNIRQAYRLKIDQDSGIILTINPEPAEVNLLDFSASGLMLSTTTPLAFSLGLGLKLSFKLTFPSGANLPVHRLEGKAVVVRLEMDPSDERKASLGLKFHELSPEARRALPKIIHYYMLEEQRDRLIDDL